MRDPSLNPSFHHLHHAFSSYMPSPTLRSYFLSTHLISIHLPSSHFPSYHLLSYSLLSFPSLHYPGRSSFLTSSPFFPSHRLSSHRMSLVLQHELMRDHPICIVFENVSAVLQHELIPEPMCYNMNDDDTHHDSHARTMFIFPSSENSCAASFAIAAVRAKVVFSATG